MLENIIPVKLVMLHILALNPNVAHLDVEASFPLPEEINHFSPPVRRSPRTVVCFGERGEYTANAGGSSKCVHISLQRTYELCA